MIEEENDIAHKIEDGSYFVEARRWYDVVYLSPMPARVFFIVLTAIALISMLFAFGALIGLMPLSPRIPFVYYAKDLEHEIPVLERLKEPEEPNNPALVRYYLSTYVEMRESYNEDIYMKARRFVQQYSEPGVFADYNRQTHPDNPRSPIRQYGRQIKLATQINSVSVDRSKQPYKAVVNFQTIKLATNSQQKTNWTATIEFFYTDLEEKEVMNEMAGDVEVEITEPAFTVTSYEVREQLSRVGK